MERRIAEAEKLGFEEIYISSFNKESSFAKRKKAADGGITVTPVADIAALCRRLFQ